jgi:hypothetical protein
MQNRNFLFLALLVVFGSFLVAFSNAKPGSNAVYEYVTLTQLDLSEVTVSEQGKTLRVVKIETKPKSVYDFQVLYEEVNKYEATGWELFSQNNFSLSAGGAPRNSFLLRRKKQ